MRVRLAAAAALVTMAGIAPGSAGAAAVRSRTVTLHPVQTATCEPGGSAAPVRRLASQPGGKPCAQLAASPTLRVDERYDLVEKVSGHFLPGASEATVRVTFVQPIAGTEAPGYVDADVTLTLNGHSTGPVHTAGVVTPDAPHVLTVRRNVPADIRDKEVASASLLIAWRTGTTPGVQPAMTSSSAVTFKVYTPPPKRINVPLNFSFTQDVGRIVQCPRGKPNGALCIRLTASAAIPRVGSARFAYVTTLWYQEGRDCVRVTREGTITVSGQGVLTFASDMPKCDGRHVFTLKRGTGRYRAVRGSGTTTLKQSGRKVVETWRGSMSYAP